MTDNPGGTSTRWLLLIHQIPPKPDYLRVKIGRRLQRVGALPVKNSVYVLPDGDQSVEDFQWIRREVIDGGGDASICRADFVDGLTDDQLRQIFRAARDADYAEIEGAARELVASMRAKEPEPAARKMDEELARLRKRFATVAALDFFESAGRVSAHEAIDVLQARIETPDRTPVPAETSGLDRTRYRARTWVTRRGVFVDRMASAWLIQRFIDPDARFRFVAAEEYRPTPGELRFDMFEGEFTHVGDRCTFETLLERFGVTDPGLAAIAEVVHEIDLRDGKYARDDAAGIERVLAGIAHTSSDDTVRLRRAAELFDALLLAYAPDGSGAADGDRPRSA